MKLTDILRESSEDVDMLEEKKEAIATSENTNITLHYDSQFSSVGESGQPELSCTISMSSVGGKEYYRAVGDTNESAKIAEGVKLEFRRALRKFDRHIQHIIDKYKLHLR